MSVGRAGKDVFVSYDRENTVKEFVRKLKRGLESAQLSVWLDDEDVPTGTEKPVLAIRIALCDCKALVVVVTKKYLSTSFCKSELYVACENKKPVFPVILEESWDVLEQSVFSNEGVKYMKASSNCVSFLPSDDYGAALQKLIAGLNEGVARPRINDVKKQELVVRNVLNVLHEAGFSDGDWYQLGQQLIEMAALKRIKASDHEPCNCMIDTIAQWLQSDLKATWEKLAEAVTKVGGYGEATANAVRQKAGIAAPSSDIPEVDSTPLDTRTPSATTAKNQSAELVAIAARNNRKIEAKFSKLVMKSRKRLQSKEVNVEDVQDFLIIMYSSPNSRDGSDTVTTVLESAESLDEIFRALSKYKVWDYLNYYLLQSINEEFASDDDELNGMMEQYQRDLTGHVLTQKIQTYLDANKYPVATSDSESSADENITSLPPKQKHKLYKKLSVEVKAKITDHSVKYVYDLWQSLANQFALPRPAMILHSIAEGCICIMWLIPANLVTYITRMAQETANMFAKLHILKVMLEEHCIYPMETELETEPCPPETKLLPPLTEQLPPLTEPPPPKTETKSPPSETKSSLPLTEPPPPETGSLPAETKSLPPETNHPPPLETESSPPESKPPPLQSEPSLLKPEPLPIESEMAAAKRKEMELLEACQYGQMEQVHSFIKTGVNVNVADSDGCTALQHASIHGHQQVVELLLGAGAKLDLQNKDGETALERASFKGHQKVVELLLGAGANPDLQDKDGFFPLSNASQEGYDEIVQVLLQAGATVDLQNKDGLTALQIASYQGHQQVVELLLRARANPDLQNKDGWTALERASIKGRQKVVELLLGAGANPDLQDKGGFFPLSNASQEGYDEIVRVLLRAGATVDLQNKGGWTALQQASIKGHQKVVELLLRAGANTDLQNKDGETALERASFKGHQKVAELLLGAGANPDLQDKDGFFPLSNASQEGYDKIVRVLLQAGATVDLQNKNGLTALQIASYQGHQQVVELLLGAGANPDLQNKRGYTALMVASNSNVIRTFYQAGATEQPSVFSEREDIADQLLDASIETNQLEMAIFRMPQLSSHWFRETAMKESDSAWSQCEPDQQEWTESH